MGKSPTERQRERRARLRASNSKQLSIILDGKDISNLEKICASLNLSYSGAISRLISDSSHTVGAKQTPNKQGREVMSKLNGSANIQKPTRAKRRIDDILTGHDQIHGLEVYLPNIPEKVLELLTRNQLITLLACFKFRGRLVTGIKIAEATSLTLYSARRAIANLKNKGLIKTKLAGLGMYIYVVIPEESFTPANSDQLTPKPTTTEVRTDYSNNMQTTEKNLSTTAERPTLTTVRPDEKGRVILENLIGKRAAHRLPRVQALVLLACANLIGEETSNEELAQIACVPLQSCKTATKRLRKLGFLQTERAWYGLRVVSVGKQELH